MLAVETPTQVEFLGMAAPAATVDESGQSDEDGDIMDFDMI
jgi:hypothetical protein